MNGGTKDVDSEGAMANSEPSIFRDGFGDFYFMPRRLDCYYCSRKEPPFPNGRHIHEPMNLDLLFGELQEEDLADCPSTSPSTKDLDTQAFPFLELPKEIRDIVYDFWVQPFRGTSRTGSIEIKINSCSEPYPYRCHYELTVPVATAIEGKKFEVAHGHLELEDYNTIRALSTVCHKVREEVGRAFWDNIHITFTYLRSKRTLLLDILEERPMLAPSLKFLTWDLYFEDHPFNECQDFSRTCDYLAAHCSLELLEVTLTTRAQRALETLALKTLAKEPLWIRAIRTIKTKELRLGTYVLPNNFGTYEPELDLEDIVIEGYDRTVPDDRYRRLNLVFPALLKPMLQQKVLQVDHNLTAEEQYLRSRMNEEESLVNAELLDSVITSQPWFSVGYYWVWAT